MLRRGGRVEVRGGEGRGYIRSGREGRGGKGWKGDDVIVCEGRGGEGDENEMETEIEKEVEMR